jgi:ABC-2 type transport system permease protein
VFSSACGRRGRSISTERIYALRLAAQLSLRDSLAVYPPRIYLATTVPRALLQVAFLTYLGYYAGGSAGRSFAFVGACVHVTLVGTVVRGPDALLDDRLQGTLDRLQLGVLPVSGVALARWWVFVAEGVAEALLAAAVVGPLVGEGGTASKLLAAAPLVLLVAISTTGLGLAVAALSLTRRVDVLLTNLVSYAAAVACGVVAPLSALGPLEGGAHLLPLTNGLLAVRHVAEGKPWLADAGWEAAVGAAWLALAAALVETQLRRVRRSGTAERL